MSLDGGKLKKKTIICCIHIFATKRACVDGSVSWAEMTYGSGPNLGKVWAKTARAQVDGIGKRAADWLESEKWNDWIGCWDPGCRADCEAASETDTSLRTDGNLVQASCVSIEVAPSGVLHPHPHQSNLLASVSQYTLVRLHGWLP